MTHDNMNKDKDQHGDKQTGHPDHSGAVATEQEKALEADQKDQKQSHGTEEKQS